MCFLIKVKVSLQVISLLPPLSTLPPFPHNWEFQRTKQFPFSNPFT